MSITLSFAFASAMAAPTAPADPTSLAALSLALQGSGQVRPVSATYFSHGDANKALAFVGRPASALHAQGAAPTLEGPATGASARKAEAAPRPKPALSDQASAIAGSARMAAQLTKPMTQVLDGEAAVRGKNFKALLSAEGMRFSPVVGNAPAADLSLSLSSVSRGGEALALEAGQPVDTGFALEISRGALVEAYRYDFDSVEQTFTFESLPGSGDLVLTLDIDTTLDVKAGPGGLVFSGESAEVHYSNAFVYDAGGEIMPISTTLGESTIELTVPAAYLASAALPITIDPVLNTFVFTGGTADDSAPDIAFDSVSDQYFVVFEDVVTATDSDIYGFLVGPGGSLGSSSLISVNLNSVDVEKPRVALHLNSESFLVVAAGRPVGQANRVIYGSLAAVDSASASGLTIAAPFEINDVPGNRDCFDPDVSGDTFSGNNEAYLVVWNRAFSAADRDIHARLLAADGSFTTGRINVDNSISDDKQCRISTSIGDVGVADYHNIVWIRGNGSGTDVEGDVYSRRVYFDGTFGGPSPSSEVLVDGSGDASFPVTTATLSRPLEGTGELVHVVAYTRRFVGHSSIYATPVTFGNAAGEAQGISLMEDSDFQEDQREVDITTDGEGFMMVYAERFAAGDYDTYYCAGHVQSDPAFGPRVTLAERHENMAFSAATERLPAIASQFDGGEYGSAFADDACSVWEEVSSASSRIEGATLDLLNNTPVFGDISLGTQYCQAAENSSGTKGWIRSFGPDQSVGTSKTLEAIDVTATAFGYPIVGTTSGFVVNPGGVRGNICVLGGGRYVNQISNSGSNATLSAVIDPMSVPQPNGFVAISPGETWYFQFWHRDSTVTGAPTSNFSNGLSMTFTN